MYRRRQWQVAVFASHSADDLLAVLALIAGNAADAIQQAYEYAAEHWSMPANQLTYIPVVTPTIPKRGKRASRSASRTPTASTLPRP